MQHCWEHACRTWPNLNRAVQASVRARALAAPDEVYECRRIVCACWGDAHSARTSCRAASGRKG